MRCPSCGTQNEPDSRFCGGCGAKLSESRVAPTQKIQSGSQPIQPAPSQQRQVAKTPSVQPFVRGSSSPQRTPVPPMATPGPHSSPAPVVAPRGSIPPEAPRSVPPSGQQPVRASSPPVASPSLAPAAPGRRWGLIAVILVVDLGLAIAGAALLHAGLSSDDAASSSSEPAPGATVKTGSAQPRPTVEPLPAVQPTPPPPQQQAQPPAIAGDAVASGSDVGSGSAKPAPPTDDKKAARKKQIKKKPKTAGPGSGSGGPIDPYDAPDPLPPEQQPRE